MTCLTFDRIGQTIRMFRPTDDPVSTRAYSRGQARALADFGVHRTTSMDLDWGDPALRLVMVEGPDGEARGGICIHQQSRSNALPVARALARLEPRVHQRLLSLESHGVAELCAGWSGRRYRGTGLYPTVIHAAMAALPFMSVRLGVGFGSASTTGLYEALGFAPDTSLGEGGTFPYPDARYRSTVMWGDCSALVDTEPAHRERILSIRSALTRSGGRAFRLGSSSYDLQLHSSAALPPVSLEPAGLAS